MNLGPRWYVIHTYSGYESKVKISIEQIVKNRGLGHLIFDVVVLTEKSFVTNAKGEQKEVETKRKPTYVFIHMIMNDESWHAVRNVTGVTGFVGPGSRPVPLTDAELKKLNIGSTVAEFAFKVGDNISVVSGAFAGYTGVLQEISEDQKQLTVLVSAGRRDISVMIDTQDARLAE
ncbi:MAG: transcription termination/antitermination protein NusG [Clostridia bacterium]|nr:transcription termination/antitermination protein NusG [Clostridia bacterium]